MQRTESIQFVAPTFIEVPHRCTLRAAAARNTQAAGAIPAVIPAQKISVTPSASS